MGTLAWEPWPSSLRLIRIERFDQVRFPGLPVGVLILLAIAFLRAIMTDMPAAAERTFVCVEKVNTRLFSDVRPCLQFVQLVTGRGRVGKGDLVAVCAKASLVTPQRPLRPPPDIPLSCHGNSSHIVIRTLSATARANVFCPQK